ncbi:MAG TPA: serine hydrolase domain-containing protein [Agriterribacter sp.]|nr:serine hydrolase domain-containing protein [Agriterribacter sp.]
MKKTIKKLSVLLLLAGWIATGIAQVSPTNAWADINSSIDQYMKEWNIPGLAVVVIKNDSVLLKTTRGYANIDTKTTITSKTLFSIGSCTKGFTSTALLLLQDENKIDLETPVSQYFPQLSLSDTQLQKQITLKDMLSHRTGFERGDYIWYGAGFSRPELLERIKYLKPIAPLRNNFIYNNLMYTVAGNVVEMVSGKKYEDFIHDRLFAPLGMNRSFYGTPATEKDFALPYQMLNNSLAQMPIPSLKGVEPAGGIWTDINDMSLWLWFILNGGIKDSLQLLSKKSARMLQTPIIFTGGGMRADETEYKSYGLGFGFTAYKGNRVMYHTGVSGGYIAHIAIMPEVNIGVVVLANTETYTNGFINNLFDRALGENQTDWNTDVLEIVQHQRNEDNKERAEALALVNNRTNIDHAEMYSGKFENPACRPIEIDIKDNNAFLVYNQKRYPMVQEKDNNFWVYDDMFGKMQVTFSGLKENSFTGLRFSIMGEQLLFNKINE